MNKDKREDKHAIKSVDIDKELKKAERKGRRHGWLRRVRSFLVGVLCGFIILTLLTSYVKGKSFVDALHSFIETEDRVEDRDMTLRNWRLFGYKAADFSDAVLGDAENLKQLEVYSRDVSDVVMLTQTGFAKISAFSKYQYITYNGRAVYTVDLSKLTADDFAMNDEERMITIKVPDVSLEPINIPSEDIEFSDVEQGILAFGDIKLTPEEQARVETEAKARMEAKLEEDNVAAEARTAAEHAIWELVQPLISGVSPRYTLKVEFKQ